MHFSAVDRKAAFDSASHDTLWALLSAEGLPRDAVQLLPTGLAYRDAEADTAG